VGFIVFLDVFRQVTQRDSRQHSFWAHNYKWVVSSIFFLGIDRFAAGKLSQNSTGTKDSRGHDNSFFTIAQMPKRKYLTNMWSLELISEKHDDKS